jgi:hypothetical protein
LDAAVTIYSYLLPLLFAFTLQRTLRLRFCGGGLQMLTEIALPHMSAVDGLWFMV